MENVAGRSKAGGFSLGKLINKENRQRIIGAAGAYVLAEHLYCFAVSQ